MIFCFDPTNQSISLLSKGKGSEKPKNEDNNQDVLSIFD